MTTISSYLLNQKSRQDRRTYFGKKKGKKPIKKHKIKTDTSRHISVTSYEKIMFECSLFSASLF